jgi:aminoglycoside phosphotransferase (APT) family kinase protein
MDPAQTTIPDIRIDLPLARRVLARLSPPLRPLAVSRLTAGGFSGAIFFVETAAGPPLVIKAYPNEPWWRMAKEAYVAGLVARAPSVLAPCFLAVDDTRELLPFRYAVMTRLEGERLAFCEPQMSEDELASVWREVGAQMRLIHAIPMEAYGYIADGKLTIRAAGNRDYMDRIWRAKCDQFRALGGDESLAVAMEKRWRERLELLDLCAAPKLCHYDIHPGNLMVARKGAHWRLSGLFDFEDSFAGDPLLDLAKCVHFARVGTAARWRGLLDGYGPIETPAWEETVELYRLYQAVEYWDWIAFLKRPSSECTSAMDGIREILKELQRSPERQR